MISRTGQALKVGGFEAAQPMAEQAGKNLFAVQKAEPLIQQIEDNGGKANIRQQAELAANVAMIVAGSSGVLTDQRMNEFMPASAMKKYGGWKEYWTNTQEPVDFSGFLPQMKDLVAREKLAAQGTMNAASQLGINIMSAAGQGDRARGIQSGRDVSPLMNPNAPKAPEGRIRVRDLKTGSVGSILISDYDPNRYGKL